MVGAEFADNIILKFVFKKTGYYSIATKVYKKYDGFIY